MFWAGSDSSALEPYRQAFWGLRLELAFGRCGHQPSPPLGALGPGQQVTPVATSFSLQGASRTFFPGVVEMLSVFAHERQ